jgi:ubiquinol-cytochrome c reductase cytochrome c subunit
VLLLGLLISGSLYTVFAPAQATSQASETEQVAQGKELFLASCAFCHGKNGEGVPTVRDGYQLGPSLVGVGAAAVDFQVGTGRMPMQMNGPQAEEKPVQFTDEQVKALANYVASLGPGPDIPRPAPEHGHIPEGLRLFTQHCAGCHQIAGEGGYVTNARVPRLKEATPTQIAQAVRIGPYLMPKFSKTAISDRQLDSIVAYVEAAKKPHDRGGWGIGHIGPVPEGMVAWLLAGTALLLVIRLLGERKR